LTRLPSGGFLSATGSQADFAAEAGGAAMAVAIEDEAAAETGADMTWKKLRLTRRGHN